jgi:hypothetical protein
MLSYTDLAVTLQEAEDYIGARALTGWPEGADAQEAALRRGQDHIAREYNDRWAVSFWDEDAPEVVQFAIIEAAIVEARAPGSLAPTVKANEAKMLTGVDSITWTPIQGPGGVEALRPRLLHVEAMLRGFVRGNTIYLERA